VNIYFEEIKKSGIDIVVNIRTEEWGDRHFAVIDPNDIGIDFVTHEKMELFNKEWSMNLLGPAGLWEITFAIWLIVKGGQNEKTTNR